MPTYDYLCSKCGYRFEAVQKISDPPLSRCPECRGKVRRLIGGGIGVIFRGSGFYVTDNRSSSSRREPAAKDKTGAEAARGTSGSGDGNGKGQGGKAEGSTAETHTSEGSKP